MNDKAFQNVLAAIDTFNEQDPNIVQWEGKAWPFERLYSEHMSRWIAQREPNASEALRIAARGQHIGRWTVPRASYPMDRGGYLRWREDLKRFHSTTVTEFMKKEGYPSETIEKVRFMMLKKNLHSDSEAQALEDALCLVFLETQFQELIDKTEREKMKEIIRKTWKKMSEPGHALALKLPFTPVQLALVQESLATP